MIYHVVFASMNERLAKNSPYNDYGTPQKVEFTNSWKVVQKVLEGTGDTLIWTVTTEQQPAFEVKLKHYGLEKYLVAAHRKEGEGTTNRNYMDKPRRLKVYIMKEAK